jgi:hypothetical protein
MRIVTLTTTVTPERTLTIRIPQDVPAGPAEVVIVFATESSPRSRSTLGDLRASEFFGMWRDRKARGEKRRSDWKRDS